MKLLTVVLCAMMLSASMRAQTGQGRNHSRSMTISPDGIVATSQMLASQAGAQILARGGSAMDAAIAANAVLGVTEPMMNGIGGDLFVLYWDAKKKELTGLNASGGAPEGLSIEYLRAAGKHTMPGDGIHSVTVPGCVDGWEKLHKRYGRLPWSDLFQAAIYHAANGFPVMEMMHGVWDSAETRTSLASDKEASRVFLPEGRAPRLGEIFRNPGLARAYRLIADGGSAAFYRGPIAEAIIKTTRKYEGTLKASDLAGYSSEWVEPIATTYRGWTVYELPPNGQGIAALQMLNVMENFPLGDYRPQSAEAMHLQIESMKAAYADLKYVRDTRFGAVPVTGLLSKEYAKRRASLVDPAKAKCDYQTGDPAASGDTTYLSVVDKEGNIASLIQSISSAWGSGIAVEGMGFLLHNRGASFEFDQSMANVLVPGKRPRHTIIPAFMEKDDVRIGFGIMGGPNQPLAHAQFVSNLVDFGMNIQAALDAPRFTKREIGGCNLYVEGRIPTEVRQALSGMGHQISVLEDFHGWMGRGQAVLRDSATGTSYGASSPRGDGAAIPEPRDYFGGGK